MYHSLLKSHKSGRMFNMSSAKIFSLNLALFGQIFYEVCISYYEELHALGQQLSLVCSARLAPRLHHGKLLTQPCADQQMINLILSFAVANPIYSGSSDLKQGF